jgi:hypothetical protein
MASDIRFMLYSTKSVYTINAFMLNAIRSMSMVKGTSVYANHSQFVKIPGGAGVLQNNVLIFIPFFRTFSVNTFLLKIKKTEK